MTDWARTSTPAAMVTHRGELPPSARPASSATARYAGSTSLMVPPLFTRATQPSTASAAQPASSSRGTRRAPIRAAHAARPIMVSRAVQNQSKLLAVSECSLICSKT